MLKRLCVRFVAGFVLAAGLASCGFGSDDPAADDATPSSSLAPRPATKPDGTRACAVLTRAEASALLGTKVDQVKPIPVGAITACQWVNSQNPQEVVQAAGVPATTWAQTVPQALAMVKKSKLGERQRVKIAKAELMAENPMDLTPARACRLFGLMTSIISESEPSTRQITYIPDESAPTGINAQQCVEGQYATVLVMRAGLNNSLEVLDPIVQALDDVAERTAQRG